MYLVLVAFVERLARGATRDWRPLDRVALALAIAGILVATIGAGRSFSLAIAESVEGSLAALRNPAHPQLDPALVAIAAAVLSLWPAWQLRARLRLSPSARVLDAVVLGGLTALIAPVIVATFWDLESVLVAPSYLADAGGVIVGFAVVAGSVGLLGERAARTADDVFDLGAFLLSRIGIRVAPTNRPVSAHPPTQLPVQPPVPVPDWARAEESSR